MEDERTPQIHTAAKTPRACAKGQKRGGTLATADFADRLYNIMAELFVGSGAVAEGKLEDQKVSGLRMIRYRQLDEIRKLKGIIHAWTSPSLKKAES